MRLLRRIADEHATAILVVTHDTRMIGAVDRVIHLRDGQVVQETEERAARQRQTASNAVQQSR
jgi:ABC-type lipoprotein export system ATPase subunit